jgi:hypothetical protein
LKSRVEPFRHEPSWFPRRADQKAKERQRERTVLLYGRLNAARMSADHWFISSLHKKSAARSPGVLFLPSLRQIGMRGETHE